MPPEINAKESSGSINRHISIGIGKGCITGAKPHEQRIFTEQEYAGQYCRQNQQHQKSVVQYLMGFFFIAASHFHSHDRGAALTDHGAEGC